MLLDIKINFWDLLFFWNIGLLSTILHFYFGWGQKKKKKRKEEKKNKKLPLPKNPSRCRPIFLLSLEILSIEVVAVFPTALFFGSCYVNKDLCPSLCDPMDCSMSGFSVYGILQARILEWVAAPFSRDLPNPGIEPRSPALQADSLPSEPPGKPIREISINL